MSITVERGAERWRATGIRVDRELDLCLITVPGLPLPPAERASGEPSQGQAVFAIGFPGGRGPVVSRGRLRALWYYRDGRLLQSDVETHPGSSGGGLFDSQGCLLGLTTFTAEGSSRLSFSLSLEGLRALEAQPVQGLGQGSRHRLTQSEDYLNALAEDPRNGPTWEPAARAWVAAEPQSPDAWFALGLALDQVGRVKPQEGVSHESVEAYRRALALRPDVRAWNNLGVALDTQNRFPEAEHAFGEALKLHPDYALAWMNLGSTRLNAQRFREAVAAYRRGLEGQPDDAQAWVRLAECYRKLKDWEAETGTLEVALRYRPLSPELWLDYGAAHAHLGHREEAEAALRKLNAWESPLAVRLERVMERSFRR
jgi:tetratricopeptide (TPR) repeat protein